MGVGMPATLKLHRFGELVWDVFGTIPYQVGSSLGSKDQPWRDVDVRVILSDEEYAKWFPSCEPYDPHRCDKWCGLVLAFSALGQQMTGLPIDFQIDQQTYANEHHNGHRSALGIMEHRITKQA